MTIQGGLYRKHLKVTFVNTSTTGISASQHMTISTPLTMTGALCTSGKYTSTDGGTSCTVGHQITISSGQNIGTITFTVTGTDPDGLTQTDTVTGVNTNTVATTKFFSTVTSIVPDTTDGTNNCSAGINNQTATNRVPIEARAGSYVVGCGMTVTGTISVTLQETLDDILDSTVTPAYIADGTFASKTANFMFELGVLPTAIRFVTNSYTNGATAVYHVIQNTTQG